MAKEILFDSERFEKRQRIKRYVIPAAALFGVIVIAAVIALIVRGNYGKAYTGGEDTAYPYTWTENRNGSILLEIDRSAAPGYLWIAPESDPVMTITERQATSESKARFLLTPKTEGRSVLGFLLQREGEENDRIFELSILASVTGKGKKFASSLISISSKPLLGMIRIEEPEETSDCSFEVRMDEDGDVLVTVTNNAPPAEDGQTEESGDRKLEGWQCVSENQDVLAPLGVIENENTATVYLRPGSTPGTALVRIFDDWTGTELTIEFELNEDGTLQLLDHDLQDTN